MYPSMDGGVIWINIAQICRIGPQIQVHWRIADELLLSSGGSTFFHLALSATTHRISEPYLKFLFTSSGFGVCPVINVTYEHLERIAR
jgi:hypothetical protein